MDTIQLIKYSFISKLLNDTTTTQFFSNNLYFGVCIFLYFAYQIIPPLLPQNINDNWKESITEYIKYRFPLYDKDESCIHIPTHKKTYYTNSRTVTTETIKTIFSLRFRALNFYLQDKKYDNISSLVEIIKIENDKWGFELEAEYILFPLNNSRIQIDSSQNIWFEVIINTEKQEETAEQNKKLNFTKITDRNYIFKLTTPGKKNSKILNKFIDDAVDHYTKCVINQKENIIIEYIQSQKDDDDKIKLSFKEYPFKSNKFLDKNIFFEEKEEFIKYINQFSKYNTNNDSYSEFQNAGLTHKATMILYGEPGTGKSSICRGILNHTGRIGVLVQWSKIKTCSEFTTLLRDLNINGKKYALSELCFIFEDFGANDNRVLKNRKKTELIDYCGFSLIPDFNKDIDTNSLDNDIDKISNQDLKLSIQTELQKYKTQVKSYTSVLQSISKPLDDELTLDCVLNTIDGINELHDAMIIFTDNHIDEIDPAFTRAGRINYKLELKNASVKTIKDMMKNKFKFTDDEIGVYYEKFNLMKDYKISPADIQNICFTPNHTSIDLCLDEIIERMH